MIENVNEGVRMWMIRWEQLHGLFIGCTEVSVFRNPCEDMRYHKLGMTYSPVRMRVRQDSAGDRQVCESLSPKFRPPDVSP